MKSDRTVLFLVLLIGVAFISFYYGEIAFHLNDKLTSVHGDGIKNYYTYAYHIKHSASFHTFDGMLHPYGDLHIFTDGHTFLAWIIKALAHWFPSISNYSIGFLNFFLIWTPLLTLGALYLLLRSFKQDPFVSAIFALGIMLMAPQFDRLYGHLSLSYSFFLPLVWLWLRRYHQTLKQRFLVYISFFTLILYFTHPYLGAMVTLWVVLHEIISFYLKKTNATIKGLLARILFTGILPLFIFQLYVIVLNDMDDRPLNKFMVDGYFGTIKAIFFPHGAPFGNFFRSLLGFGPQLWERHSYIGIITDLLLGLGIALLIYRLWKKEKVNWKSQEFAGLYAGILVLIVVLGFPLKFFPNFFYSILPPLRQIRVMARFSWIVYFVLTVYGVLIFTSLANRLNFKKSVLYSLTVVAFAFFFIESEVQHEFAQKAHFFDNFFKDEFIEGSLKEAIEEAKSGDFQAILALPYYSVGGERLSLGIRDDEAFSNSLLLSYHSGLPLMNFCLSRTSGEQVVSAHTLMVENYESSPLSVDLKDDRALFLYSKESVLFDFEKRVLEKANLTKEGEAYSYGSVSIDALLGVKTNSVVSFYRDTVSNWLQKGCVRYQYEDRPAFFNSFDQSGNEKDNFFRGGGALRSHSNDMTSLWKPAAGTLKKSKSYWCSFWFYSDLENVDNVTFFVEEVSKEGKALWTNTDNTRHSLRVSGDWTYVRIPIDLAFEDGSVEFFLNAQNALNPEVYLDQFLLWERGTEVYYEYEGELYKNNFPVTAL